MLQFLDNEADDRTFLKDYVEEIREFFELPEVRSKINLGDWQAVIAAAIRRQRNLEQWLLPPIIEIITKSGIDVLPHLSKLPKDFVNNSANLLSAAIPDSIVEIEENSFFRCKRLETVKISGQSLISIGNSAFQFCESLHELHLPASLQLIKPHAFEYCSALKRVEYGGTAERCKQIRLGGGCFPPTGVEFHCTDAVIKLYISSLVHDWRPI